MRRLTSLLTALLLLAAGCTTAVDLSGTEWTKAGIQARQLTLDQIECAREAREAGWTPDLIVGGLLDVGRLVVENGQRTAAYNGCMTTRGYQRA